MRNFFGSLLKRKPVRQQLAGALGALLAGLSSTVSAEGPQRAGYQLQSPATIDLASAHLPEPLARTSATSAEEDGDLASALASYRDRPRLDDLSALEQFVKVHPRSGWVAGITTNLGLLDLHYGYFSRALNAWRVAWQAGKSATAPDARAVVDRAVGERARLLANLGQIEQLQALFRELGGRRVTGSATEAIQVARETLDGEKRVGNHIFICGPLALRAMLLAHGATYAEVQSLEFAHAPSRGTNMAQLVSMAPKKWGKLKLMFRRPGEPIPNLAVVQWKMGHFGAIVEETADRIHIKDTALPGGELWITPAALDDEASGYMLVPSDVAAEHSWRTVSAAQAARIWGRGGTVGTQTGNPGGPMANGGHGRGGPGGSGSSPCPLCAYDIAESNISLILSDTPVGYDPPIGPSAKSAITYNQRNDSQPAHFSTSNLGPKWSFSWQTFITDDPATPGNSVTRYLPAGGAYYYTGYSSTSGRFASQTDDGSVLVRAPSSTVSYKRLLRDGTSEVYSRSDGSTSYPRNIYLTDVIDAQGNALHLNYDSQNRILNFVDAAGRQTTFSYNPLAFPMQVTSVTDPFGRSAKLTYDSSGRLSSITDVIGLTSSFQYDANSLVNAMTTPYGTTTFAYTAPGTSGPPRFLDVTDPLGKHEREEWLEPAPVPASDPTATVPAGMPVAPSNGYLQYRDSFHWDKEQYVSAGCTVAGGCDYTKARDTHFLHYGSNLKSSTIESIKEPLENRVWYQYPGQPDVVHEGTFDQPTAVARVLDNGSTQLGSVSYDANNFFVTTQVVDPLGRTTNFVYANGIDLQAISQKSSNGVAITLSQFTYNYNHRPLTRIDAAGQLTTYQYNPAGQLASVTDALGHTIQYHYNPAGDLTSITDANSITARSFTYDAADRIATVTDSEGWTVSYSYDKADRLVSATYPDSTRDTYVYDKLDLASHTDRLGRTWTYAHDAVGNLTAVTDPIGNQALLGYNGNGQITSLSDANSHATTWGYDVQGRLTSKHYADASGITYAYENTTSRLKSQTDALSQIKQFSYALDNRLLGLTYSGAVNTTPNVTFTYDPFSAQLMSMTDGTGVTQYSYTPPGSFGALQVLQETGPPANGTINYSYDTLGRLSSRAVAGSGSETFGYDALGRVTSHSSDLGAFTLAYLGETGQITARSLSGSTLKTQWSYLTNTDDRRLKEIDNTGLTIAQYSNFQVTSDQTANITGSTRTSDVAGVYPGVFSQTASYNNLNQLTNLSGQALTYDANGNLLSDGLRNYSWDAENRLVLITYPGQPGKQTAFTYDGLGRRAAEISTPAGGGTPTTVNFLWCGLAPCQARDGSNTPTREYLAEGEYVLGGAQPLFYGTDQIGSVRRVFAGTTSAPAFDYDEYGDLISGATPVTDVGFAGMIVDHDSGLNLTKHRAYGPNVGRWLARDPLGEISNGGTNLYAYVGDNPLSLTDPLGLCWNWPHLPNWARNHPYIAAGAGIVAGGAIVGCFATGICELGAAAGAAGEATETLIPRTLVRVIPSGIDATTLAAPGATDAFVSTPEAIKGLDASGIAQKLTIPESQTGYQIIEFATPEEGLAQPVFRTNPGFVGNGYTAGGAPEYVVPNGPIPAGATITTVP